MHCQDVAPSPSLVSQMPGIRCAASPSMVALRWVACTRTAGAVPVRASAQVPCPGCRDAGTGRCTVTRVTALWPSGARIWWSPRRSWRRLDERRALRAGRRSGSGCPPIVIEEEYRGEAHRLASRRDVGRWGVRGQPGAPAARSAGRRDAARAGRGRAAVARSAGRAAAPRARAPSASSSSGRSSTPGSRRPTSSSSSNTWDCRPSTCRPGAWTSAAW